MTMIQLKSCRRCGGDMMLEEVMGEQELVCLQCGYRTYPAAALSRGQTAASAEREPRLAA